MLPTTSRALSIGALLLFLLAAGSLRAQPLHGLTPFFARSAEGAGFVVRGTEVPAHVGADGIRYLFVRHDALEGESVWRLDLELVGARTDAPATLEEPLTATIRSVHRDAGEARPLEAGRRLIFTDVYPSVDLVYRLDGSGLKYEFHVRPGGDPNAIRLRYRGGERPVRSASGGLRVATPFGSIEDGAPLTWVTREKGGRLAKTSVSSSFALEGEEISFAIADYDRKGTLVIDPSIIWSTYFGGSGSEQGFAFGGGNAVGTTIESDAEGNLYVVGTTLSTDLPTSPGSYQPVDSAFHDVCLLSFTSSGALRWATYFGGSNWDIGASLAVDEDGTVAVTGITNSVDLPTTAASAQRTLSGSSYDLFVARFRSDGSFDWCTYMGGNGMEQSGGAAIDHQGNIVVGGTTWSSGFNGRGGSYQSPLRGEGDPFLLKLSSTGSLRWLSIYGGKGEEWGSEVTCDRNGSIFVVGSTRSTDMPCGPSAHQPMNASPGQWDAYLLSFDSDGRRRWGTYFGGSGEDRSYGVAVDCHGGVVVGGTTLSTDLPTTAGAPQRKLATAKSDAFIARFYSNGSLAWSTYYGGRDVDYGSGVAASANGHAFLVGYSTSDDLLKSGSHLQERQAGKGDLLIVELDSAGKVVWDTYYGGSGSEQGSGIAGDGRGGIVVAGYTNSEDLPIRDGMQPRLNASSADPADRYDLFVARFCNTLNAPPVASGPTTICEGDSVTLAAPPGYDRYRWIPGGEATSTITVRSTGAYSVFIEDTLGCSGLSDSIVITVNRPIVPVVDTVGTLDICQGESVRFSVNDPRVASVRWSTGDTARTLVVSSAGSYAVELRDLNGCRIARQLGTVTVRPAPAKPTILPGDTVDLCPDDTIALLDAGAGYAQWRWSTGYTGRQTAVGPGRYWVTVTGANGCSVTSDTVVVRVAPKHSAPIALDGPAALCSGDTLTLDAGAGFVSYLWSNGATTRTIRTTTAGSFAVTRTDISGCTSHPDTVTVTIVERPTPTITSSGPTRFCDGDSVELDAGPGYGSYLWSTGDTTRTIRVGTGGRYDVSVAFPGSGCRGVAPPVHITVDPLPMPAIVPLGPLELTLGDSLLLILDRPYAEARWSTGERTDTLVVRESGRYAVEVTDANGCVASATAVEVVFRPAAIAFVTLPKVSAKAGSNVLVPLRIRGENLAINGVTGVTGVVTMNRTLLVPDGATPSGVVADSVRSIRFSLAADEIERGVELPWSFVALLGTNSATRLAVQELEWEGGTVETTIEEGLFSIDGNCTEGGDRKVDASGSLALKPVQPNPSSDRIALTFTLLEDGLTTLSVVDLLGRERLRLAEGYLRAGSYVLERDIAGVPTGSYTVVLITPTGRVTARMEVAR